MFKSGLKVGDWWGLARRRRGGGLDHRRTASGGAAQSAAGRIAGNGRRQGIAGACHAGQGRRGALAIAPQAREAAKGEGGGGCADGAAGLVSCPRAGRHGAERAKG